MRRWVLVCSGLVTAIFCQGAESVAESPDPNQQRIVSEASRPTRPVSFSRDVVPALTRAGCNAGVCHGSFQGRGGLQLSLLGFDAGFDYEVLAKASRGRRINVSAPERSLLLLKPTGAVPHGGGRRIAGDSEAAAILYEWIRDGTQPPREDDLAGLRLTVEPGELTLQMNRDGGNAAVPSPTEGTALRVVASFADGSARDVTAWALYDVRDKTVADVSRSGVVAARRPGKTAVAVKYQGQVASISVSVPYTTGVDFEFPARNYIDQIVAGEWKKLGVAPSVRIDDSTFIRRVYIDLIGTLPTVDEVRKFVADTAPDKRSRMIDELLMRAEYVDYWSLRWGDLLRAHRRYLGEKGLSSFNGWIRQSVRDNKPLDVMTRELLTAKGNLFTNGPVAYYFIDDKVEDLAETTSQVFLGIRLQCTKCHHHPNEVWSQQDYYGLAAFFSSLEMKDSGPQGAKFGGPKSVRPSVIENPNRKPQMAVAARVLAVEHKASVQPAASNDRREQLAEWIAHRDNPYFARNFANRYWAALFRSGLVEPVDDLRATNPPSMPRLLDALASDLADHQFDPKHLLRTICNSQVYQLASEQDPQRDLDGMLLTHWVPFRLSAEVLLDAINQVIGTSENFPGLPQGTRAIALPDPSVTSLFLTTFGRPDRNNACDCSRSFSPSLSQALQLINSNAMANKLAAQTGRLPGLLNAGRSDDEILDELYLAALARHPKPDEQQSVRAFLATGSDRRVSWEDVFWAVLNSKEFLLNY